MTPIKIKYDTKEVCGLPTNFPNTFIGGCEQYLPPFLTQLLKFETNGCTHISAVYYNLGAYANYLLDTNQWPQAALDFWNGNGFIVTLPNGKKSFQFSWEYNACLDGTSINE